LFAESFPQKCDQILTKHGQGQIAATVCACATRLITTRYTDAEIQAFVEAKNYDPATAAITLCLPNPPPNEDTF